MSQEIVKKDDALAIKSRSSEEISVNEKVADAISFVGASKLVLTPEEKKQLNDKINEEDVEIRPDGLLYMPQALVRDTLNRIIGQGEWALIPLSITPVGDTLNYEGRLYIRGHFVSQSVGDADYIPNNKQMTWATVLESAKSNCLIRCCKDLGIGGEMWEPRFTREWKKNHAVRVWRTSVKQGNGGWQWRRKEDEPWDDESDTPPIDYNFLLDTLTRVVKLKKMETLEQWFEKYKDNIAKLGPNPKGLLSKIYGQAASDLKIKETQNVTEPTSNGTKETKPAESVKSEPVDPSSKKD